eukprot:scaffold94526_cov63-Phaeocystis_antarctica.AAC.5
MTDSRACFHGMSISSSSRRMMLDSSFDGVSSSAASCRLVVRAINSSLLDEYASERARSSRGGAPTRRKLLS